MVGGMFLLGPGQQFDSELDTVAGGATMAQGDPFQGVESKSEEQGGGSTNPMWLLGR